MNSIRFSPEDLDLFSSASHDRNPLHLSDDYARRTPYGGRVVFGVLDGLKAMALLPNRPDSTLASVEFEFFDTALLGIDYSVQLTENSVSESVVRVMDGRRPVLEAVLTFRQGTRTRRDTLEEWKPSLSEPRDLSASQLPVGTTVRGKYAPSPGRLMTLCERIRLRQDWATDLHLSTMMWASYLVGMELPGKRALFSRLLIEFQDLQKATAPFEYVSEVTEVSDVGELTIQANLQSAGTSWAKVMIGAHVREDLPLITTEAMEKLVGRSQKLAGKVALVTGASRGLGASLVRVLALNGCTVLLNYARSQHEAERLQQSLADAPGRVALTPGDAANTEWCLEAERHITEHFKRLDFLICNASPPLLPLWLEVSSGERVDQFIRKSLAMVSAPMMALLPSLATHKGWNILISSTAVSQPHPYFPHYVVAKSAAEALLRAASTEYRTVSSLIVRPSRLLTDLTNTPLGRRGAMPPEYVASAVLRRVLEKPVPGQVEILDQFPVNG
jgi:NAD(P)-dependent dehydrogenase (short-subunit alcohol dehydrogenase family)